MPKLSDLKVDEVSLCAKGMNQHARVALFKADTQTEEKSVEKKLADDFSAATLKSSKGDESPSGGNKMPEDTKKADDEAKDKKNFEEMCAKAAKADDLEKRLAKSEAIAKLTDAEKSYMAKLADDTARDAWLAKSATDRKADIEKAASGDETLTVGGQTVRKSEVGAGTFAVLKSQQEAIAKQAELLAKAQEATELATLSKRAADEYGNLPGSDMEKAHVLRALESLPESVRKSAEAMFKAGDAGVRYAFEKRGTTAPTEAIAKGVATFNKAVADIQARDKCSKTDAMAKAIAENPDAYAAYQAATSVPAN